MARASTVSELCVGSTEVSLAPVTESFTAFGELKLAFESYSQFERDVSLRDTQAPSARLGAGIKSDLGTNWNFAGKVFAAQTVYVRGLPATQSDLMNKWVVYLQAGGAREIYRSTT